MFDQFRASCGRVDVDLDDARVGGDANFRRRGVARRLVAFQAGTDIAWIAVAFNAGDQIDPVLQRGCSGGMNTVERAIA